MIYKNTTLNFFLLIFFNLSTVVRLDSCIFNKVIEETPGYHHGHKNEIIMRK